ncbi:cytochrome b/b6 domain-containing protein [Chloroflexota bacterium]
MQNQPNMKRSQRIIIAGLLLALLSIGMAAFMVSAGGNAALPVKISPLHPAFAFLDADGVSVLESGAPVSTMLTCGVCHDTNFIAQHNLHSDLGLSDIQKGLRVEGKSWDFSNGAFGKWDPLTYRYLSQMGDERLDLGTSEWLKLFGGRTAGGGPAVTSRSGQPLENLSANPGSPETSLLEAENGEITSWDWSDSGTVELDCFLCHTPAPDGTARAEALAAGDFRWANTATLLGTSLVSLSSDGTYSWNQEAFDDAGLLLPGNVAIQSPQNNNCAQCHGLIHEGDTPLVVADCSLVNPQTAVTGQVISGDKISESGLNLAGKENLSHAWDIHAERQVNCVDCHYSLNNPIAYQESSATRPSSLLFDPRSLDFGEYLKYPDHNIARGQSAQFTIAPELKGTMRRCESCHDADVIHVDWLPYTETHMTLVACETCHIPQLYAPAIEFYDWTVLTPGSTAVSSCRGKETNEGSVADLVTGFEPVLMLRQNIDLQNLVAPYNLVTAWYWVYDEADGDTRPVRIIDLQAVFFSADDYAPEILNAFDYDGDGQLTGTELRIDTEKKEELVAGRLADLGLLDPRIQAGVQPYNINHGVVTGEAAISDCAVCHQADSRLNQPIKLADYVPAGVMPEFVPGNNVTASGELHISGQALFYQPQPAADGLYIFGHSRFGWIDRIGEIFFLAVLLGVGGHGTVRIIQSIRKKRKEPQTESVYLYQAYERFWHWLQTLLIVVLLLTGLIIHRPDLFGWFSFNGLVIIHNVSAAILAINAFLSLFYHLTTGEIRSFIPRPYGFFDDAIEQTRYYLSGIFRNTPHPFNKTPASKMNPLQKVTYFGILNVLLPLQGITGILMWGAQKWPQVAAFLGGLPNLAGLHTLVAWLFAAFIIAHVYLTTTGGHRPMDSIKAMVTGWEDVEVHQAGEYQEQENIEKEELEENK